MQLHRSTNFSLAYQFRVFGLKKEFPSFYLAYQLRDFGLEMVNIQAYSVLQVKKSTQTFNPP